MKKSILIAGGVVIAAGAACAAGWYMWNNTDQKSSDGDVVYVSSVSTLTENETGAENRFSGVVEPQETVEVKIENGRKVNEVKVKTGEEVKKGQLLFEYDLSSIQDDLQEAKLALDRLKNEALSLKDQIATLEAEKKKASANNQLSYTIEIETNKMNLKKNEYDQKSKEAQIARLERATANTEVRSEMDGVIQKIDTSKMNSDSGDVLEEDGDDSSSPDGSGSDAFITILSTGSYRIKGKVNEQNMSSIIEGEPVIIRSRVDDNLTWRGTMGSIDQENADTSSNNNNYFGMMDSSGDSMTSSSSYPFYVELDSSDGLMLGQHVYIEHDVGQDDVKPGLWLSEFFIADADTSHPYVWMADEKDKLKKQEVVLGQYDETLGEYEIADGLNEDNCIAFPSDVLEAGMRTEIGDIMQAPDMSGDPEMDGSVMGEMDFGDEMPEIIEEPSSDMTEYSSEDDLVPMDEAPDTGTDEMEAAE